jgi:hydroxymethylpyrimidine/phosphomethylpyrimidine kinase
VKTALSIAATDPTAGAGAAADLKTFGAFGVYGYVAVTAVTVQSRGAVLDMRPVPADVVEAQIRAVGRVDALKVGVVATAENARAVAAAIRGLGVPVVLDPVLSSSGGVPLLGPGGREALLGELLPACTLVTPNLAEASALTGEPVRTRADMERAAARLSALGPGAVLVKGGHLQGDPADLLWSAGRARWLEGERIAVDLHGSGCALSSAIAAGLALGRDLADAVGAARAYVTELLREGSAVSGPGRALADHFAPFRPGRPQGDGEA